VEIAKRAKARSKDFENGAVHDEIDVQVAAMARRARLLARETPPRYRDGSPNGDSIRFFGSPVVAGNKGAEVRFR